LRINSKKGNGKKYKSISGNPKGFLGCFLFFSGYMIKTKTGYFHNTKKRIHYIHCRKEGAGENK